MRGKQTRESQSTTIDQRKGAALRRSPTSRNCVSVGWQLWRQQKEHILIQMNEWKIIILNEILSIAFRVPFRITK